jgi:hypothetical protein
MLQDDPARQQRDDLRFAKAFFEVFDRPGTHARLLASGALELSDGSADADRWYLWRDERPAADASRGARFLVRLRERRLVLEGPSPEAVGRGWRALERALKPCSVARVAAGDDLARFLPRHRRHAADRPESWSPEYEAQVLGEFYAVFCRRWAATPHPRLDGRSPLDAARDPALRPRLEELLARMDRVEEERRARRMPSISVGDLRNTLWGPGPHDEDPGGD